MPGDLFKLKGDLDGEVFELGYATFVEFLNDKALTDVIDKGAAFVLWSGNNRLTARPIISYQDLREKVVANATIILRRLV